MYDLFGSTTIYDGSSESTRRSSSYANAVRYTGRACDAETDIYHYRHRYYDSASGRFCSRDPIGFQGSRGNLYAYMGGRPLLYVDPYGLSEQPTGFGSIILKAIGLVLSGHVSGPCKQAHWRWSVKGKWFYKIPVLGEVGGPINQAEPGVLDKNDCPNGFRCFHIYDQTISVSGSAVGVVRRPKVKNVWPDPPWVNISLTFTASSRVIIGICVKTCVRCPPKHRAAPINIERSPIKDLKIEYPDDWPELE